MQVEIRELQDAISKTKTSLNPKFVVNTTANAASAKTILLNIVHEVGSQNGWIFGFRNRLCDLESVKLNKKGRTSTRPVLPMTIT
jgi:hypothetical protein